MRRCNNGGYCFHVLVAFVPCLSKLHGSWRTRISKRAKLVLPWEMKSWRDLRKTGCNYCVSCYCEEHVWNVHDHQNSRKPLDKTMPLLLLPKESSQLDPLMLSGKVELSVLIFPGLIQWLRTVQWLWSNGALNCCGISFVWVTIAGR